MSRVKQQKLKALEARFAILSEQYKEVNQELDNSLDPANRPILRRKIDALETKMYAVEQEINQLNVKGIFVSPTILNKTTVRDVFVSRIRSMFLLIGVISFCALSHVLDFRLNPYNLLTLLLDGPPSAINTVTRTPTRLYVSSNATPTPYLTGF